MILATPYGNLFLAADDEGLTSCHFVTEEVTSDKKNTAKNPHLQLAEKELADYFAGKLKKFTVPLHITSGTTFQQNVWQALSAIPYGETRSYQDIAIQVDSPKAVRAIGQANRANPIAIIIPCHRVIGKNGKLTGYMGGGETGIKIKEQLLKIEGK